MSYSMGDVNTKQSISHAFYTYAHINATTNKIFYIGKGSKNRYKSTYKRSTHWNNIVNKYGFNAEILANWNSEKEAFDHEKLLISCFKDMNYVLANKTNGGEGTASDKVKQSALNRPKRVLTEETKKKISLGMIGRKLSAETCKKISDSHKNKIGHIPNEETRKKMSNSLSGKNHPMFGKKHSEDTKKKMSKAKRNKHEL